VTTPAARLLDITRLSTRAGRVLTGVDRVELAYLNELCAGDLPCFAICKTNVGYVLLDRAGMLAFAARFNDGDWPRDDLIRRLSFRLSHAARSGQTAARRYAIGRARPNGLPKLLARLPGGFSYINVGHSNLTERMFAAVRAVDGARITVMLHDTIPLDLPQFQRPQTVALFDEKLRRVACYADQILCPTASCRADIQRHMNTMGRTPPILPALLSAP